MTTRSINIFFARAFDVSAPRVLALECIDLVIEDHALLLLSWEFAKAYKVSVPLVKKKYRLRHGSVVLKIPADANTITVFVHNTWRKKRFAFELKKIVMDKETANVLIRELHLMPLPSVHPFS